MEPAPPVTLRIRLAGEHVTLRLLDAAGRDVTAAVPVTGENHASALRSLLPASGPTAAALPAHVEVILSRADSGTAVDAASVGLLGLGLPAVPELPGLPTLTANAVIDFDGREIAALDVSALKPRLVAFLAEHRLDALAICGMNAPLNPAHEVRAARLVHDLSDAVIVVEGRYLTSVSGSKQRATAAGRLAVRLLQLRRMIRLIREAWPGDPPSVRLGCADEVVRVLTSPGGGSVRERFGATLALAPLSCEARITREGRRCYACTTARERLAFESLAEARTQGEGRLREELRERADLAGWTDITVELTAQDHYAPAQGRKGPLRVYLDSRVTATAHPI